MSRRYLPELFLFCFKSNGKVRKSSKDSSERRVVVPIHAGKDLKQGALMGMIQDIGIDYVTFFKLLGK